MSKHRSISQKKRLQLWEKYDHHCAYCGCELQYKDMQVDHIKSIYRHRDINIDMSQEEVEDIENLMPSCRMCNFYKASGDIEYLRKRLSEELIRNMRKPFDYRLALKYGLIEEHIRPIQFYFEKK